MPRDMGGRQSDHPSKNRAPVALGAGMVKEKLNAFILGAESAKFLVLKSKSLQFFNEGFILLFSVDQSDVAVPSIGDALGTGGNEPLNRCCNRQDCTAHPGILVVIGPLGKVHESGHGHESDHDDELSVLLKPGLALN